MGALISVIVPAYNAAKYIEKCLDSILAQTYRNIEIIVVDDGSVDETAAILEGYALKNKNIRVIHQKNGGVTSARLRGIAEASGEWIGFVDSDDYIEPQMYERLLANAIQYEAEISHCGYQLVLPKECIYYYNTGRVVQQKQHVALRDLLDGAFVEPGLWNKLYQRKLLDAVLQDGVIDRTIHNTEDLLMNYYLFRQAKQSVYEDVCPYHYILRVDSATTTGISEHKLKDPMRVLRILMDETAKEPDLYMAVRKRYLGTLIGSATMDCKAQKSMIEPYRMACRKELRKQLPLILKEDLGAKRKMLALWAGISPNSYGLVHRVYAKIRRLDKSLEL